MVPTEKGDQSAVKAREQNAPEKPSGELRPWQKRQQEAAAAKAEEKPKAKPFPRNEPKDEKEAGKRNLALVTFPAKKPDDSPGWRDRKDASKSGRPKLGWLRIRHIAIAISFIAVVAIPTALVSLYMLFVANDQYHSSAAFSVRSIDGATSSDILGMFSQASTGDTASDSYILTDYIQSRGMFDAVSESIDIENVYAQRGADWFFALTPGEPIENKIDYWADMVHVEFDNSSGIIGVSVRAFDPQSASAIATEVVNQSERLINDLSETAREEVLRTAQNEVSIAEERLREARAQLRDYRNLTQEIDPSEAARLSSQLIGALEQQLSQARADLNGALSQMGPDSPRVRVLQTTINSLESQIEAEREALGSGSSSDVELSAGDYDRISERIQRFEELETEREFAERAYTSALGGLESARSDASSKQRYLAIFSRPALSEDAQYPQRWLTILLVALGTVFVWAMGVMGYYNIRDRA